MAHSAEKRSQLTDTEIRALSAAQSSYNRTRKTVRAIMSEAFGHLPPSVQKKLNSIFGDWVDERERDD